MQMNRQKRHDLAVVDVDVRGNPRQLVVIEDPEPVHAEIVEVAPQLPGRPAATSRLGATVEGDYVNRAKGFSITTMNISIVVGILFIIAAFAIRDTVTFGIITLWFFTGFCVVWLISYVLHVFISPEGAEMLEILMYWRFINREQAERHRRMRGE
jgi:hypothetical protein